jgi:hypothetical protein
VTVQHGFHRESARKVLDEYVAMGGLLYNR